MAKNKRKKRRTQTYVDKKKLNRDLKKKNIPKVTSDYLIKEWEKKRAPRDNLRDMGLAIDPNQSLHSKPTKLFNTSFKKHFSTTAKQIRKPQVIQAMESDIDKMNQEIETFSLPSWDQHLCKYMLEKHKDDYKAMARDKKNIFQLTPSQLRRRLYSYHLSVKTLIGPSGMSKEPAIHL